MVEDGLCLAVTAGHVSCFDLHLFASVKETGREREKGGGGRQGREGGHICPNPLAQVKCGTSILSVSQEINQWVEAEQEAATQSG